MAHFEINRHIPPGTKNPENVPGSTDGVDSSVNGWYKACWSSETVSIGAWSVRFGRDKTCSSAKSKSTYSVLICENWKRSCRYGIGTSQLLIGMDQSTTAITVVGLMVVTKQYGKGTKSLDAKSTKCNDAAAVSHTVGITIRAAYTKHEQRYYRYVHNNVMTVASTSA